MPSFLSTYSSVGIPVVPRASQPPVPALSAPSLFHYSLVPSTSSPTLAPSVGKAFVVGQSYAPIPGKLVAEITSGAFVELADLLAENIRAQEAEPHTYLDGKLLVAPAKKRVVEITDILTWIQAFTIYQWIFCSTYPSRWQDTTQYKLLILQTASQFPGPAWLNYDTAFRKDAAASLLADWSKMNLDLYLLRGHGLTFWFAFSALHFLFSCGPGRMGSQKTVRRELSPSLSGRFSHPGSS